MPVPPASFTPIGIVVLAPGAFFVLAALTAFQNYLKIRGAKKGKDTSKIGSGCSHDCMNCGEKGCAERFYDTKAESAKTEVEAAKSEKSVSKEKKED